MLDHPDLGTVLGNTVVWVVAVVVRHRSRQLALAQFLTRVPRPHGRALGGDHAVGGVARHHGRLFVLIYDYNYGILNHVLLSLDILDTPIDFLGDDRWTMPSMIAVGVFVSLPFTTYVLLAGLNAIPGEVVRGRPRRRRVALAGLPAITLPLLRPALLVASVLNMIYVFNSFPIVWTLNDRNPGLRARHDDHVHVQAGVQERGEGRRHVGRGRRRQRAADPRRRRRSTCAIVTVGGGEPMARDDRSTPGARGAPGRPARSHSGTAPRGPLAVGGAFVALVFVAPYLVMLLDALRTSSDVGLHPTDPVAAAPGSWDTFAQVLADERFLNWLKSSLIVAATSTVLVLLVAVPAAYFTARHQFPGRARSC